MEYIINGTEGDDNLANGKKLIGHNNAVDKIYGYGGNDSMDGLSGNDWLYGMDGDDLMAGGAGNDKLYGGNNNDTLYGDANDDTLDGGAGNDTLDGGTGKDALYGGSGNDTYHVRLGEGDTVFENAGAGTGTDTIYFYGAGIATLADNVENGWLFAGGNEIYGNASANLLYGNEGANILDGKGGADTMTGGGGNDQYTVDTVGDTIVESALASGGTADWAIVSIATYTMVAGLERLNATYSGDVFTGYGNDLDNVMGGSIRIEKFYGGAGDDALFGAGGNDVLSGGADDDTLTGGTGADVLQGGTGIDTVNYSASFAAVTVDLRNQTASGGEAGGDTLSSIENVTGSNFDDTLIGNDVANQLLGGGGNDHLTGGAGADILNGGNGIDAVHYETSTARVGVNLATGVGKEGDAAGDTYFQIENAYGSAFNDALYGNGESNSFYGLDGDDTLRGEAGVDYLYGGDDNDTLLGGLDGDVLVGGAGDDKMVGGYGNDTMTGGGDKDRFDFSSTFGNDKITDFQDGLDTIRFEGITFADLNFTQTVNGAMITIDGQVDSILLTGIQTSVLSSADFLFI